MLVPVARAFRIAFALCLACASASYAGNGLLPDGHLDTSAVRDGYLRADMPFVRATLEGFIRNHPREVGAEEKVFTHLYLGATYAGEKDGRNRAEAHFRAALKLDPYSDPANLYLPPAIKTWFERLRADVLRAQAQEESPSSSSEPASAPASPDADAAMQRVAPMQREAPAPPRQTPPADTPALSVRAPDPARSQASPSGSAPGPSPEFAAVASSPSRNWVWWTLGTAAAAGAGALTWAELDAKPKSRRIQVDATLK